MEWHETYELLSAADPSALTAAELDELADALFWLDRPEESITARGRAYRAHVEAEHGRDATLAAWRLFYDHFLVGEVAVAQGWLERARTHAADADHQVTAAWLA